MCNENGIVIHTALLLSFCQSRQNMLSSPDIKLFMQLLLMLYVRFKALLLIRWQTYRNKVVRDVAKSSETYV